MASNTGPSNSKGPVVDPGICRCCRSIKKCRVLSAEYDWTGQKEIYADMMMDCFGLLLSHLDGPEKESCICATCVVRLREASAFRRQVLTCEEAFLQAKLEIVKEDKKVEIEIKTERLASEDERSYHDDAQADDDFCNDSDDTKPLTLLREKTIKTKSKEKKKVARRKKDNKQEAKLKNKLLTDMKKMKAKLKELDDNDTPAPKKKKSDTIDQEHMAFHNTVVIVKNSFVCPFLNRVSNYYCFYCKDQFTDPAELREHTMTHDPKDFTNSTETKKPPKIDISRIDCRLCPIKIDDLATFKKHVASIHDKQIYDEIDNEFLKFKLTIDNLTCTECGCVFPYFDMLKKHMVDHFGTYTCDSCGACFLEHSSLITHIRTHNKPTVEVNFPCEICGKNLKSKYSRYLHIATIHEKKPTVNCYKCDQSFLSHALKNRHLIEVHGDKRTFPCKLCDKVYNRRKTLMEHNRRNHLKVFRHQCDLCDQKFYLPSRLKEHMVTHTGERNFRCDFCEKSYPRLKSLREHMRTHTNERRFKCDVCNATFTQNGSLRSHIKSHHSSYQMDSSSF